jgi:hypothetical protein
MSNEKVIEVTGCQVVILLASVKGGRKPPVGGFVPSSRRKRGALQLPICTPLDVSVKVKGSPAEQQAAGARARQPSPV